MTTKGRLVLLGLPLCLLLPALGCGKTNPSRGASLTGKVTYKGAPVTGGNVQLYTDEGVYPAVLSPEGTFEIIQVPLGEATLTVETESINPNRKIPTYGGGQEGEMSPPPEGAQTGGGTYVKIPSRYDKKETSDLKVTLTGGKQTQEFQLKD